MALYVDGPACTIEDLVAQDSGLLDTAENEGIDVSAKIQLAVDEVAPQIQLWLDRPRSLTSISWRPLYRLEQLIVTPATKKWQAMTALSLFYRDAYFSQLVDRFQAKWNEFSRLANLAREEFIATGMPMVSEPVFKAKIPTLNSESASQGGGTFYACVSYINDKGQEGAASDPASMTIADGNAMTITPADNVAAWNVYAGTALNAMYQQNLAPLGAGDVWVYVPGSTPTNYLPCRGQVPEFVLPLSRNWMRG